MARIGDTPEQQRVNDANEAQRRRRVDQSKKLDQNRRNVAFADVMQQKTQQERNQKRNSQRAAAKDTRNQQTQPQQQTRNAKGLLKSRRELAKRAAVSQAAAKGGTRARNVDVEAGKKAEVDRYGEIDSAAETDRERVKNATLEEQSEILLTEEGVHGSGLDIDPDRERSSDDDRQQEQQSGQHEGQPEPQMLTVEATGSSTSEGGKRLPDIVIREIAKAIAVAAASDGKSEVMIQLKGPMFEGVTLRVGLRKGKVRCSFDGCDRNTRNLIDASKGELMRALSKKGLELDILRAR